MCGRGSGEGGIYVVVEMVRWDVGPGCWRGDEKVKWRREVRRRRIFSRGCIDVGLW